MAWAKYQAAAHLAAKYDVHPLSSHQHRTASNLDASETLKVGSQNNAHAKSVLDTRQCTDSSTTALTTTSLTQLGVTKMEHIASSAEQTPSTRKRRVQINFPAQGKTKQSMRDECDINNIMAKYQTSGLLDFVNKRQPQYGDVTGVDFTKSMQTVAHATEMFMEIPSSVRKEFNNNPSEFFEFVNNPDNRDQAVAMGIFKEPLDRRTPVPREERTRASDKPEAPTPATPTPPPST